MGRGQRREPQGPGALPSSERSAAERRVWRWLTGDCASFARAVQDAAFADAGVELRLGCHRSRRGIEHVFAHDDERAYDALGVHERPYRLEHRDWADEYDADETEIEAQYPVDEDAIERAAEDGASEIWLMRD